MDAIKHIMTSREEGIVAVALKFLSDNFDYVEERNAFANEMNARYQVEPIVLDDIFELEQKFALTK